MGFNCVIILHVAHRSERWIGIRKCFVFDSRFDDLAGSPLGLVRPMSGGFGSVANQIFGRYSCGKRTVLGLHDTGLDFAQIGHRPSF